MKTLLVTGGAGFIGSNFIVHFLEKYSDYKVVNLDALTYAGDLNNLTEVEGHARYIFEKGDICDRAFVENLFSKYQFSGVIHFAAESHVDRSISSGTNFVHTNTIGTQVILDSCRKHGISKYLQVSTDEVYGSIDEGSWNEEFPLLPNSPYSASKAGADLLVRAYGRTFDIHTNVTRCSNNYGPYQYPEKVIPLFVTNLIQGKQIPMYGKGLNVRDWLHVDDHCRGIELVLNGGHKGEIYNIGGGTELSNIELATSILDQMGFHTDKIEFVKDRLGHDKRYSVDISKIKAQLGYTPQIPFSSGLESTIDFYQQNHSWWESLVTN
jgi:dTDP-glucose 4,6-dehydratase